MPLWSPISSPDAFQPSPDDGVYKVENQHVLAFVVESVEVESVEVESVEVERVEIESVEVETVEVESVEVESVEVESVWLSVSFVFDVCWVWSGDFIYKPVDVSIDVMMNF